MPKTIKTPMNYEPKPVKQKFGKSLTIPDQSLNLRKILEKYRMGAPVNVAYQEGIFEDENFPNDGINPKLLDLTDVEDIKNFSKNQIDEQKRRKELHDKKNQALQRKKQEEEKEREIREKIAKESQIKPE